MYENDKQLVQAIRDVIFMFKDIEKARQLPSFAQAQAQYVAMGKELELRFKASSLFQEEGRRHASDEYVEGEAG